MFYLPSICSMLNRNVTWTVSITLSLTLSLSLIPSFIFSSFLPSHPFHLSVFPKYVSLYHMRHRRMGLSEAGNDFFVLISALRGIRVVLVIRPFITLPARHSAVWVNAISPDSHNYPKIERGREISLAVALWVRESLVLFQPTRPAVCMCTRVVCLCDVHLLQQK